MPARLFEERKAEPVDRISFATAAQWVARLAEAHGSEWLQDELRVVLQGEYVVLQGEYSDCADRGKR